MTHRILVATKLLYSMGDVSDLLKFKDGKFDYIPKILPYRLL